MSQVPPFSHPETHIAIMFNILYGLVTCDVYLLDKCPPSIHQCSYTLLVLHNSLHSYTLHYKHLYTHVGVVQVCCAVLTNAHILYMFLLLICWWCSYILQDESTSLHYHTWDHIELHIINTSSTPIIIPVSCTELTSPTIVSIPSFSTSTPCTLTGSYVMDHTDSV